MLFKKMLRTAWKYKAQFISMIVMLTLGAGIFLGFNMEWASLEENADSYFSATNFADYRIYSDGYFSKEDIAAVKEIEGVDGATRFISVDGVEIEGTDDSLSLAVTEEYGISSLYLVSGAAYNPDAEGIWLSDKYAAANGVETGDSLTLRFLTVTMTCEVMGLVKSPEYLICLADDNQVMPDYTVYGFAYATPKTLEKALFGGIYTQINVLSSLEKSVLEERLQDALGSTYLVLSLEENAGYVGMDGEIEEGKTMGSIIPVLFLLIAVLTMLTTMHRIAASEKIQSGTLKALGFKDAKITRHYACYGLFVGLVSCLLGAGLGVLVCYVMINPYGMMATYLDLPYWTLHMPWFSIPVLVALVALVTLASYLSVRGMIRGTAAEALRPYAPKKVKSGAIEKTRLWAKLPFTARWNVRDMSRHKARSAMTLLGVVGCVVLIVASFGMRDSMSLFMEDLAACNNYETRINVVSSADGYTDSRLTEEIKALAVKYNGDWFSQTSVKYGGSAVALEIYSVENDMLRFGDVSGNRVTLGDGGAYVCVRLLDEGVEVGGTVSFTPYGSDVSYEIPVAGVVRSQSAKSIVMTAACAEAYGISYKITAVFTDTARADVEKSDFITGKQSKDDIIASYDSFMEIMNTSIVILIAAAAVLGIFVLYNLGVMSYIERIREMATLKVVGFRDRQIGKILIGQNVFLTVIGILLGLPLGYGVLVWVEKALAAEYELVVTVSALSFVCTVFITLFICLAVGFFIARKSRKIDMAESLKSNE